MAKKRKTLPKGFQELLEKGDVEALKAVYDTCELDAVDDKWSGRVAIAVHGCPDELARWLVAQGLDVDTPTRFGHTPLAERVSSMGSREQLAEVGRETEYDANLRGVRLLLELGADPNAAMKSAANNLRADALRLCLEHGGDATQPGLVAETLLRAADQPGSAADCAELLLAAGAEADDRCTELVEKAGQEYEFRKDSLKSEVREERAAGLQRLNALFGVAPAAERRIHDGVSRIDVTATNWKAQHDELWEYLVPANGPATTVQGEVTRLAGRIWHEIYHNGAANWDADFKKMTDALATHLTSGNPAGDADEAATITQAVRTGDPSDETLERLVELSVAWVLANPDPQPLPKPPYRR
jgi:hypothetical protein